MLTDWLDRAINSLTQLAPPGTFFNSRKVNGGIEK